MSNLRIIHKNLFDTKTSASLVAGASASGFPLTNLESDIKTDSWRSTNLSTPEIQTTWNTAVSISGFALAFTNLIAGSTARLRLYDATSGGTLLLDSTINLVDSIDPPAGFSTLNSACFNFGGGVHLSAFFDTVTGVKRAQIALTSASNPDGFIEIGRMIIGDSFEPEDNAEYGARTGFEDNTRKARTSSGNLTTNRGTVSRFLEFSMGDMSENDNFSLLRIFRRVAMSQPIFLSLIPDSQIDKFNLDLQIYGLIDDSYSHILEAYNLYSARIKLMEV